MRSIFFCLLISSQLGSFSPLGSAFGEEITQPSPAPQGSTSVSGRLLERGTRAPLSGVNVFVLPSKLKAVTDESGRFSLSSVPLGDATWVINLSGYERLEKTDLISENEAQTPGGVFREFFLEKRSYQVYETTIYGKGQKRDDTSRGLKASQFQVPGSGGDPLKAIQNLPGVNRAAPLSSTVIIQGSAPRDTRYTIDGHEVPIIFHFGGLSSVVIPEALDSVDYLSAGFGAQNGRAIGGLVGVWTRTPSRARWEGFAFADTYNAGALVQGPVGEKSSFLIGGRQSYIGHVLRALFSGDSDFNLTVAPSFTDLTTIYETEVTPIDRVKLVATASQDTLEFLLNQPVGQDPAFRGTFYSRTAFFRVIPQWFHKHSERASSQWSLGIGRDTIKFVAGENYFNVMSNNLTARAELELKATEDWISRWGIDNRHTWAKASLLLPSTYSAGGVGNPFSSGEMRQTDINTTYTNLGGYWRNELKVWGPWTLLPAIRVDYFSATKEVLPLPRFGLRYQFSETLNARISSGLYAQPPQEGEIDPTYGNPDIDSPRAWHLSGQVEKDFREGSATGFIVTQGAFYKRFNKLVIPSTARVTRNGVVTAENYNNLGEGKAYGAETLVKLEMAPLTGWLSYTLSRSTRWNPKQAEYVFGYDQTHLLTAVAAYELGRHWRLSGRYRYVTGNPYTPIVGGTFDSDNDVYIPTRGVFYSKRVDPFNQLDVRIDKRWVYDNWILSIYLDIQNLTNRKNPEDVQYAYDFSSSTTVTGLPVFPTFGLKAEF